MKHTRYFLIIVLALLTVSTNINAQWESKTNGLPYDWNYPYAIAAKDANYIMICITTNEGPGSTRHKLYFTEDGGENWRYMPFPGGDGYIVGIDIREDGTIRVTSDTYLYTTSDEGERWSVYDFSDKTNLIEYLKMFDDDNGVIIGGADNYSFSNVKFVSENTVYAKGGSTSLFKSVDGGISWSSTDIESLVDEVDYNTRIAAYHFSDEDTGVLYLGDPDDILLTEDGGETWSSVPNDIRTGYTGKIKLLDANTIFVATEYSGVYWTLDGGETWMNELKTFYNLLVHDGMVWGATENELFRFEGNEWVQVDLPYDECEIDKSFSSGNKLWMFTYNDEVYSTNDSGNSWSLNTILNFDYIINLEFTDNGYGWVSTNKGEIYKSDDAGATWTKIYYIENQSFNSIDFWDNNKGVIGADYGELIYTDNGGEALIPNVLHEVNPIMIAFTEDGGETWTNKPYGLFKGLFFGCGCSNHFDFLNKDVGYIVPSGFHENRIFKTTDGGNSWSKVPHKQNVWAIDFYDEDTGYMSIADYNYDTRNYEMKVAGTLDGGENWTTTDNIVAYGLNNLFAVAPWDKKTIFMNHTENFAFSTDGGITWSYYEFDPYLLYGSQRLDHILPIDENNTWILGRGGLLLHSSNPTAVVTGTYEEGDKIPTSYILNQNYPNPFNPSTQIKYSIPEAGHVTLKVFDILGRQVATLVNTQQSAGTYQVTFNAEEYGSLASGVYMYQLTSGDFSEAKKFILSK